MRPVKPPIVGITRSDMRANEKRAMRRGCSDPATVSYSVSAICALDGAFAE